MNKKILISLSVIAAVAAIAIGGTIAYFSDTETSTGNTFTAGSLDLVLDIEGEPLVDEEPIFEEDDMKPGDSGETTISLHVDNDACGFVNFDLDTDQENSCVEPELADELAYTGEECNVEGNGELNDEVMWLIWRDEGCMEGWQCSDGEGNPIPPGGCEDPFEGNNIFDYQECDYDEFLTYGPLVGNEEWGFGGIKKSDVQYYGFAWCFGNWEENGEYGYYCNGFDPGNEAQSDSFTATMTVTAQQERNQYPEGCPVD